MRKCEICGIVRKTTFHCIKCRRVVCLSCYNFVYELCKDCETDTDNLYYKRVQINGSTQI